MTRMEQIKDFFLQWAEIVDAWRVVPRAVLFFYGVFTWNVYLWIKTLESPTVEQTGILYAVIGVAGMIFNFYAKSGRAWGPQVEWKDVGSNDYLANQRDNFYSGARASSRRRTSTTRRRAPSRRLTKDEENEDELD